MCIDNWARKGIVFEKDIPDENGKMLSFQSLQQMYSINGTFLDYAQLKRNAPKDWLRMLLKSPKTDRA